MKRKTTFKRLVTNLPFNPSLIHQVSFYGKRLKQETSIRRLGFAFIALTFFVQLFAVLAPPKPSLASDVNNDLIPGGFSNRDQATLHCLDRNSDYSKILLNYGITCDNVATASTRSLNANEYGGQLLSMGRLPYGKAGEYPVSIGGGTYYWRNLNSWGNANYTALEVTNVFGVKFFILFNCGNLVSIGKMPEPKPNTPPPAVKTVNCNGLFISVTPGAVVKKGTTIAVRGLYSGQNLGANDSLTINYDYINADTGQPVVSPTSVPGIKFVNGIAEDKTNRLFTLNTPGHYIFRTAALWNGNIVAGSLTGNCTHRVNVEKPPVDVCPDIPGTQTDEAQCKPCDKAENNDATVCVVLSKTAKNETQKIDNADGTVAHAGDVITYTLSAQNTGKVTVKKFSIAENISDILDYAEVIDYHGGVKDNQNVVRWPSGDIKAGQTMSKQLTVRVKNPIPQTPVSASNPGKFDLTMTNVYGNTVNIRLPGSTVKTTEQLSTSLPNTGPGTNLVIAFVVVTVAGYFFARSRLMAQELRIVQHEYTSGV